LGENLGVFFLGGGNNRPSLIKYHEAGAGRPLVDRPDVRHARILSRWPPISQCLILNNVAKILLI